MNRKLSVVIIAGNEEMNIRRCLRSVDWADERLVVDTGSTDSTFEICSEEGCRVVRTEWRGFGPTKRFAVDSATSDWVFSLDADEEVTGELAAEIRRVLVRPEADGYRVKRRSYYLGRAVSHCGWNRDYTLRLFDRSKGNFNQKTVHESVRLQGSVGTLKNVLLHHTYPTLSSHFRKMDLYSTLGAEKLHVAGRRSSIPGAVLRGNLRFLRMYLLQLGFLDGRTGFMLSLNSSIGVYWKYLKLWRLNSSG